MSKQAKDKIIVVSAHVRLYVNVSEWNREYGTGDGVAEVKGMVKYDIHDAVANYYRHFPDMVEVEEYVG